MTSLAHEKYKEQVLAPLIAAAAAAAQHICLSTSVACSHRSSAPPAVYACSCARVRVCVSHAHTRTHTRAHIHIHTHKQTHTHEVYPATVSIPTGTNKTRPQ